MALVPAFLLRLGDSLPLTLQHSLVLGLTHGALRDNLGRNAVAESLRRRLGRQGETMSQANAAASPSRLPALHESRKAIFAAAIGNVLEWYDFGVYVFFASVIARNFFPPGDPAAALLSSFAVFGVGFLMRPLGGIIIGRFGDIRGRKPALMLTIMTMAFGTVMVGVLPGYASIGVAAPVLLVVARLIQGFSAGGEWGGSTAFMVEWSPHGQRGWYSSFQQASIALSLVLGSGTGALLTSIMSAETLNAWGWRIPFLFGIVLALVGAWLRRNIDETPAYRAATPDKIQPAGSGFVLALRAFGFTIHWTVAFYILLSYMPTFTRLHAGVSQSQALWSNTIGVLVLMVLIPLFGALSDRVGRRPLLMASCAFFAILTAPLFLVILDQPGFGVLVLIQGLFGAAIALYSGAGPAAIAEIFHTIGRSTWMTPAYALSVAIFGGFAPFIATWLISATGSPLSPAYYVIAAAVVSFIVNWQMPETAHRELD
jgi:MFS transporter, MHS family, proline/betaine transporter